jgi:hypothetical protein
VPSTPLHRMHFWQRLTHVAAQAVASITALFPTPPAQAVGQFLQLSPFTFRVHEAHNTHIARSVHVGQAGSTNVGTIANHTIESGLSFGTHCILHEFYRPYAVDLDGLLAEYGYPLMRWDTASKGGLICPSRYRYWRHLKNVP